MTKEKPILFSAPMVRAILEGRKTQTRRVLKNPIGGGTKESPLRMDLMKSPYGKVGDELWVRESVSRRPASFLGIEATNGVESAFYVADGEEVLNDLHFNICPWFKKKICPSIHMPRWASRIQLKITGVRVERLQDISEEDATAEGYASDGDESAKIWFRMLWAKINGQESWNQNPFVWVIEFERIKP